MNRATHLVNAALPIGLKLDTEIEIRNEVEGGEFVEKVSTVDRVHAARRPHRNPPQHETMSGSKRFCGVGLDDRAETHFVYGRAQQHRL